MKPLPIFILVVAAVAITAAIQESRIAALRKELAAAADQEAVAPPSRPGVASGGPAEFPAAPASRTKAAERPAVAADGRGDEEELGKTVRKMWENPAGKAMMNQGVKVAVAMMYEDFIESLDLTKEEADYFKTLLGQDMADQQELGMKMMGATPAEREELVREIEERKKANEEAIKAFLNNDDDHKRFTDYQDRLPDRQQLDGIRAVFAGKGAALDEATGERLVEAMYQARTAAKAPDLSGADALAKAADGGLVDSFEQSWDAQEQAVMKEAGAILDESQLEAFKEYRQQMKEMQLMSLKMAEKMMGGEGEEE